MGVMKSKRKVPLSPTKLSWHLNNNARGKINDMIKMNFSYLNKDELSAQMYNADTIKEHESMQNMKRRQKITRALRESQNKQILAAEEENQVFKKECRAHKTRVSSALTRNSMHNQTPSLSVFRQSFN